MRAFSYMVAANIWLVIQLTAAYNYPRVNNATTTSPTKTIKSSVTSTSYITGPFLEGFSSTWSQYILPVTVGTVMVTVNKATNQTYSTTIYHTDFEKNGSATLLTRTDTNAAGTVTHLVTDAYSSVTTVVYPTNFFEVAPSLTWVAILPTFTENATACVEQSTYSPTPTHSPFIETSNLDTADPQGWLYTLIALDSGEEVTQFGPSEVSSLFTNRALTIPYTGCTFPLTSAEFTSVSPIESVPAVPGNILATSTTTISSLPAASKPPSSAAAPASTAAPQPQSQVAPTPASSNNPPPPPPVSTEVSGAPPVSAPAPQSSPPPPPQQPQQQNPPPANSNPAPNPATDTPPTPPPPFITAGQTIHPGSSITLGTGGPSTTIIALQTSGSNTVLVVNGASETLTLAPAAPSPLTPAPQAPQVITVGSSVVTANSASQFVVGGQTLVPGGVVTVGSGSGATTVALQSSGSNTILVVNGASSTLSPGAAAVSSAKTGVITIGSSTITANSASQFVVGSQTLVPGGTITLGSGAGATTVALNTGASVVVVNGVSATITPVGTAAGVVGQTATGTVGIGGLVWSIVNGGGGSSPTATGNGTAAQSSFVAASGAALGGVRWGSLGVVVVVVSAVLVGVGLC